MNDDDTWSRVMRAENRARVRECVDLLPEPYRMVLLLRDIQELDTEQTALMLNVTPGNVKTRLHRARQCLRVLLEERFSLSNA
jgi:RNA polymerase sigma-70 factor (ECF subfamily)